MTVLATAPRLQRLLHLRQQHRPVILRRDRADQLVDDGAFRADDERLGHAIDAPLDRGAAVGVGADAAERVAVAAEEAPRVVGRILVVDADELEALVLGELGQQRRFVVTGHAPGRPDIDEADLALERGGIEPGHLRAVGLQSLERRQHGLRRGPADQRGGNSRRIAAAEPEPEQHGKGDEGEQRQHHQEGAALRRCGGRLIAHGVSTALRPERRVTPLRSSSRRRCVWLR